MNRKRFLNIKLLFFAAKNKKALNKIIIDNLTFAQHGEQKVS